MRSSSAPETGALFMVARLVDSRMNGRLQSNQILRTVVGFVLVDMVDVFAFNVFASILLFRHSAVHILILFSTIIIVGLVTVLISKISIGRHVRKDSCE